MDITDIPQSFAKEWPVITQAPMSFVTATFLLGVIIWWLFHWRYGGLIALLRQQAELYKVASEQASKTKEVLFSSGVFIVQRLEHQFWWQDQRGVIHHLVGEKPEHARLALQVMVRITAPSTLVEYVSLEVMGKHLQSDWEAMKIDFWREQYVYVDFSSIRSGSYSVRLVAGTGSSVLGYSSLFEIEVPRFNYENA